MDWVKNVQVLMLVEAQNMIVRIIVLHRQGNISVYVARR